MEGPKTLLEAIQYFSDEQICIDAVAAMRWPDGPVCPDCLGDDAKNPYYLKTQKRWKCRLAVASSPSKSIPFSRIRQSLSEVAPRPVAAG